MKQMLSLTYFQFTSETFAEMKQLILEMSNKYKLPLYTETCSRLNHKVYERYGSGQ